MQWTISYIRLFPPAFGHGAEPHIIRAVDVWRRYRKWLPASPVGGAYQASGFKIVVAEARSDVFLSRQETKDCECMARPALFRALAGDSKHGAGASLGAVLQLEMSMMGASDRAYDMQAKTRSSDTAGIRGAEVALADITRLMIGHPYAMIPHFDFHLPFVQMAEDGNRAFRL